MKIGDLVVRVIYKENIAHMDEDAFGLILEVEEIKNQTTWHLQFTDRVYKVLWNNGKIHWEHPGRIGLVSEFYSKEDAE